MYTDQKITELGVMKEKSLESQREELRDGVVTLSILSPSNLSDLGGPTRIITTPG